MRNPRPQDFEYILLPGKVGSEFEATALHNELFDFWNEFWGEVLLEVTGERRRLTADDFLRQDSFAVLMYQNQIIGIHAYSFFNLSSIASAQHSYFEKYFNKNFLKALQTGNFQNIMTMEYFSVAKDWRAKRIGISLAKLIVVLGLRLARECNADGTITAARADVPAANIARNLGAISLVDPIEIHTKPTELMLFPKDCAEPEASEFKDYLNYLWHSRVNYAIDVNQTSIKKIA